MAVDRKEAFTGTQEVLEQHRVDLDKLQDYMEANVEGFEGTVSIEQFKGGQSNPTFKIEAGGKTYVMRRKPPGELLKSAHAVDREYRVITALGQTDVPVPKTYALCIDDDLLGTWFYIMDYCEGRIFWTPHLEEIEQSERASIYKGMVDALAKLHSADHVAIGLEDYGRPGNYVSRQINTWSKQYRLSETETIDAMEELLKWMPENVPDQLSTSVIHGDFRLDNMIFHPTEPRVIAILDWELSTLGNPLADLNYNCMPYNQLKGGRFSGMSGQDINEIGIPTQDEYIAMYCDRTGRDGIDHWDFYTAYNMFKLAAISQGIMGRVVAGTAASQEAIDSGKNARPQAERAWALVQEKLL